MKRILFLIAIMLPILANAMKIEKNEIDEFTGKQTVITSWEKLEKGKTNVRFRYQNDKLFLDFKTLFNGAIVVSSGSELLVKGTNGEIIPLSAIGDFSGGRGLGAVGLAGSAAWGIEVVYTGDIKWLEANIPMLMRLNTTDGYIDIKISEKEGKKLQDLAKLLFGAIK